MKKVLVEFHLPDDCPPSVVSQFIMGKEYRILMMNGSLPSEYALELISTVEFPIDVIKDVFSGAIEESDTAVALHPELWEMSIIGALKKNPFWDKLTASTPGHYYFSL